MIDPEPTKVAMYASAEENDDVKVATYSRCSTTRQDLDSQIIKLKEWAVKNKYKCVGEYQDYAVSGKKDDRKGVTKLLQDAEDGKFQKIGVVELSRLGRSIGFIHTTIENLAKKGIRIVLIGTGTEINPDTIEGCALLGGLALAADIEWRLIKERNARGRMAIKTKGIKVGRKRKEVSIEAIKALQRGGSDGKPKSLRQIAKELGVSTPTIMRRIKDDKLGIIINGGNQIAIVS
jgi:DNA invertase Pin-like site-specific DNA recombinase